MSRVREGSGDDERHGARDGIMDIAAKMQRNTGCKMGELLAVDVFI